MIFSCILFFLWLGNRWKIDDLEDKIDRIEFELRRMKKMIIDLIADLHGAEPKLEGGDLLIVAGDLTVRDEEWQYLKFYSWLHKQSYNHYIFIAGNHDNLLQREEVLTNELANTTYLCDSGVEIGGFKFWGSPWTKTFEGMNEHCKAFTLDTEDELAEKFALIPRDIDILITHGPPFAILDLTSDGHQVGSTALMSYHMCTKGFRPKLWVWGHIHEAYGTDGPYDWSGTKYVNASIMNEKYQPVNKPIRIEL